jgi:predicted SnoaL-like aldol condensation-catalyzing enzyme
MASVNGDMVTMYGEGVDIFRVKDGKLTDHWDASPPAEANMAAHAAGFAAWVMGDRKAAPPSVAGAKPAGVEVTRQLMTAVNTGPLTPYAETAKESDAKRTVFSWNYQAMILGKPQEAAQKYLADNFCDHSHMVTRAQKECGTRAELMAGPMGRYVAAKEGTRIEMPTMGTVSGEMVTLYGPGVDIFRVVNGKITDHWDASPPKAITVKAHPPEVPDEMIRVLRGEARTRRPGP